MNEIELESSFFDRLRVRNFKTLSITHTIAVKKIKINFNDHGMMMMRGGVQKKLEMN